MKEEIYKKLKEEIFKRLNKEIFGIEGIEYETNQILKSGTIWQGFIDRNQDFIGRMKSVLFFEIVKSTSKDIQEMKERYLRHLQNEVNKKARQLLKQNRINTSIQKAIRESVEKDQYFKEVKNRLLNKIDSYISSDIERKIKQKIKEDFHKKKKNISGKKKIILNRKFIEDVIELHQQGKDVEQIMFSLNLPYEEEE